jgi:hypothetical protein
MTVVQSAKRKVSLSLPYQPPAGRNSGVEGGANENVVVQIPDRCLTHTGVVKEIVRLPVAVKIGGGAYDDS